MEEGAEVVPGVISQGEQLPERHPVAPHIRLVGELLRELQALRSKPSGRSLVERDHERVGGAYQ